MLLLADPARKLALNYNRLVGSRRENAERFRFAKFLIQQTCKKITVVYTIVMKTVLNVKIEQKLKKEAQRVAKEMGLPMSFVVNKLLGDFVIDKCITFSAFKMSDELEKKLVKIEKLSCPDLIILSAL